MLHPYYVVEVAEPPENCNKLVCVPNSWIFREVDDHAMVKYPLEPAGLLDLLETNGQRKEDLEIVRWTVLEVYVKSGADSYEHGRDIINQLKIQENKFVLQQSYGVMPLVKDKINQPVTPWLGKQSNQSIQNSYIMDSNQPEPQSALKMLLESNQPEPQSALKMLLESNQLEPQSALKTLLLSNQPEPQYALKTLLLSNQPMRDAPINTEKTINASKYEQHPVRIKRSLSLKREQSLQSKENPNLNKNETYQKTSILREDEVIEETASSIFLDLLERLKKRSQQEYKMCSDMQQEANATCYWLKKIFLHVHKCPDQSAGNTTPTVMKKEDNGIVAIKDGYNNKRRNVTSITDDTLMEEDIKMRGETEPEKNSLPSDDDDSQLTLRYRDSSMPGLVEISEGTGIYVDAEMFEIQKKTTRGSRNFARWLFLETFSDKALETCSLTGKKRNNNTKPKLNSKARKVVIDFIQKIACEKNWDRLTSENIKVLFNNQLQTIRHKGKSYISKIRMPNAKVT